LELAKILREVQPHRQEHRTLDHRRTGPYRDLDEMITVQHPGGTAWFHTFDA
ncbi:hypothetical protein IAE22_35340, partial [Bacillus sp. S34]|nr:hypothetical protein [Bacillus sp. S34]